MREHCQEFVFAPVDTLDLCTGQLFALEQFRRLLLRQCPVRNFALQPGIDLAQLGCPLLYAQFQPVFRLSQVLLHEFPLDGIPDRLHKHGSVDAPL